MTALLLTKRQARQYLLYVHGLNHSDRFQGKDGILAYLERAGCIQFDPLNVVGTNPELVLQSRIRGFDRSMLSELLYQDRQLLDYWDKNMAILPVSDWPAFKRVRSKFQPWCDQNPAVCERMLQEIERRGPLCSGDLNDDEKVAWGWGPTRLSRAALEGLHLAGQLIVANKVNLRKYYDLPQRQLPSELLAAPDPNVSDEAYYEWFVLRRIGSVGMLWNRPSDAWLGIPFFKSAHRNQAFRSLLAQERIQEIHVEDVPHPLYIRSADRHLLDESLAYETAEPRASILAPLDNLIWDRVLIQTLFDFEYRWEVYKPQAERKYGYYVLPVLYGDRIVARFDPVKHKKGAPLTIRNWWWEVGIEADVQMTASVLEALERFAAFLGTTYDRASFAYHT